MGRPVSFDRQQALDAATDLIWARGYHAASMTDLVAATGLNKSSLYNSFGSKHAVLTEAIAHYSATQVRMLDVFLAKRGLRAGLRALLDDIVDSNNDGRGCLLLNCTAELAPRDRGIASQVRAGFDQLASVLAARAVRAQADRELAQQIDCTVLAKSLIALMCGLRILAKAQMERRALRTMARRMLQTLLPPPRKLRRQ